MTTTPETLHWIAAQLNERTEQLSVNILIQPAEPGDVATVDAIAKVLGIQVANRRMGTGGSWHRTGQQQWDTVSVGVFTGIPEPLADRRERLAAELAALDAQIEANCGETG